MKKMMIYAGVLMLAVACNTKETKNAGTETTTPAATVEYPYTLEKPWKNWTTGDPQNTVTVMKMLKAWESKNIDECLSYFGDSTVMVFDKYRKKLSQDSLRPFLQGSLADYETVKIHMQDWESVVSEDKKEEWVTVWYKQTWVDKKGVKDSLDISDEARLENGKIKMFVEYSQHYPMPKK